MSLTLDDLHKQVLKAELEPWEARTAYHKTGYADPGLYRTWKDQLAKFVFATDTFEIARHFGLNAAMLSKLSDGGIDPRPRSDTSHLA